MKYRIVIFLIFGVMISFAQEVSITVYNQNRALVKEIRLLKLDKGTSSVSFTDVAAQIDPTSVHFKSITAEDKIRILEQNFEYDLVGGSKILSKYIDQEVHLVTEKGDYFQGTLLSAGTDIVIRDSEGAIKIIKQGQIQYFDLPKLPEGLITRPTLIWQVDNQGSEDQNVEISYLTTGINWHAEYVALINEDDTKLDLSGWVSVENNSGASYPHAKLKVVAGDVNMIQPEKRIRKESRDLMTLAAAEPQFEEKTFFEYHLYTLQRPTTLKDNQIKQISLFSPAKTKTDKLFIYEGNRLPDKVQVYLEFQNKKSVGLGIPLPKGVVRVYKSDSDGALEFIGEDRIDHTPVDENVRLFVGNAFDLTGERRVMDSRRLSDRSRQDSVEIILKNHKKEQVTIQAVENFGSYWQILNATQKYTKKDADTAEFEVVIPPNGEVNITYQVILSW